MPEIGGLVYVFVTEKIQSSARKCHPRVQKKSAIFFVIFVIFSAKLVVFQGQNALFWQDCQKNEVF